MQNMTDLNIMADNMKIGIFGGAFNPVHNGHINLAKQYMNELKLDKLLLIPTAVPPHKSVLGLASEKDRLNMLKLAIDGIENIEVSDIEFKRIGKSYTFDTLTQLKKLYPNSSFYLIIGADQLFHFDKWYKFEEILSLVTLCTCARENEEEKSEMIKFAKSLNSLDMNKFFILNTPVLRVSSSEVREKIKSGEDVSSLVPDKVLNYICERGLYSV